jgi:hypothetical protein
MNESKVTRIDGRVNDQGKAVLPVIAIASDGVEIEVEAEVSLQFDGFLAMNGDLARSLGWRCLGARRAVVGFETRVLEQYIGTVLIGRELHNVVILGGVDKPAVMGQRLIASRTLTVNYAKGEVRLD